MKENASARKFLFDILDMPSKKRNYTLTSFFSECSNDRCDIVIFILSFQFGYKISMIKNNESTWPRTIKPNASLLID